MFGGLNTLEVVLLLLAAAVLVVGVLRAINLPPVLGYLAVGALIGPHGFNLMKESEGASHLAEFGVVFLMFSIGLEFSLARLFAMKRIVFGLGSAQVVSTIVLTVGIGMACRLSFAQAFALGGILAMSSTAILSKLLTDRLELDSKHGRETIGVLLFQDLAVVPLMIIIPTLSLPPQKMAVMLGLALFKVVVLLSLVLLFGQKLMRNWFTLVAQRKSSELFMLNVLLITLGLAWLSQMAGLSMALGAFLAGMLISETEYRYQVEEDIKPFRDVLLGLFFITVGMFLDVRYILKHLPLVLTAVTVLLTCKFALVASGSRFLMNSSPGTAVRTGLWLCAGGEFGFVLLSLVDDVHLFRPALMQVTVAALVLSMLLAPLIVQVSDKIVLRFIASEWLLRSMELTRVATQSMDTEGHVLICGYGRTGQYMARFLTQEHTRYVALDLDPERVREASAAGDTVVYGDAARSETLIAAGIKRASVLVISFNNTDHALRVIHQAHQLRPELPVVVRTPDEIHMEKLLSGGAAEVVPDTFESSIMLASHALAFMGIPLNRVVRRIREIRSQRYALMRGFFHGASDLDDSDAAHQARLHSVVMNPGAAAIGKRIVELGLDQAGVTFSALRRRNIQGLSPSLDVQIQAGDVLVLLGTPAQLELAEVLLLQGTD